MPRQLRSRAVRSSSVTDDPSSSIGLDEHASSPLSSVPYEDFDNFRSQRSTSQDAQASDNADDDDNADIDNGGNDQPAAIVNKIEDVVESVVDALTENRRLEIHLIGESGN